MKLDEFFSLLFELSYISQHLFNNNRLLFALLWICWSFVVLLDFHFVCRLDYLHKFLSLCWLGTFFIIQAYLKAMKTLLHHPDSVQVKGVRYLIYFISLFLSCILRLFETFLRLFEPFSLFSCLVRMGTFNCSIKWTLQVTDWTMQSFS